MPIPHGESGFLVECERSRLLGQRLRGFWCVSFLTTIAVLLVGCEQSDPTTIDPDVPAPQFAVGTADCEDNGFTQKQCWAMLEAISDMLASGHPECEMLAANAEQRYEQERFHYREDLTYGGVSYEYDMTFLGESAFNSRRELATTIWHEEMHHEDPTLPEHDVEGIAQDCARLIS